MRSLNLLALGRRLLLLLPPGFEGFLAVGRQLFRQGLAAPVLLHHGVKNIRVLSLQMSSHGRGRAFEAGDILAADEADRAAVDGLL